MPSSTRALLLPTCMLLLSAGAAWAQEDRPVGGPVQQAATEASPKEGGGVSVEIRARGSFTFSADIDDTDGDVQIGRAGFGINLGFQPWERARLSLGLDEEVSWYLFDNATGIIPSSPADGDPFELALTTTFSPRLSVQHDQHWAWFVGGIIQVSGEPDADIGDSATYGGFAGARYAFSENFGLSFGFAAKSRLEDDAIVIPLIGLDWKINERVTVATEGTFGFITVKLADEWNAVVSGGWELRDYRLDDDAILPDGVVSDSRVPIGLAFEWKPSPNTTLSIGGGVVVWQEFEFRDNDGDDVSETNTDPAPFIGVSATFRF
jgi:hypothetical protein